MLAKQIVIVFPTNTYYINKWGTGLSHRKMCQGYHKRGDVLSWAKTRADYLAILLFIQEKP